MRTRSTQFWEHCATTLATLMLSGLVSAGARGQTVEVLHNFGVTAGDGNVPSGGLIADVAGNFYGTTGAGGRQHPRSDRRARPIPGLPARLLLKPVFLRRHYSPQDISM